MTTRLLQLIYAPDGAVLADEIVAILAGEEGLEIQRNPPAGAAPPPEQLCVLAFLLTPDAFANQDMLRFGELASVMLIPTLPVVPVLSEYRFDDMPDELAYLKTLNAVGWDQGTVPGEDVGESIRKLLGLVPFKRDCQVFISYKRSDGAVAGARCTRTFQVQVTGSSSTLKPWKGGILFSHVSTPQYPNGIS